jgi:glutaminyl-tRNA synthetase
MSKSPADLIPAPEARRVAPNFITEVIDADLKSGKHARIVTRFPPEPNGYAHLGHAFASYLDFMTAQDYGGVCHLRMDDTNPEGETQEYADSIIRDMQWVGWDTRHLFYASDYYEQLYQYAEQLIQMGLAYVESVSAEEMARLRGTAEKPGTPSPYRNRSVEENLELFRQMRAGKFKNGEHALRAKIDLAHPNFKLRDPVLYRIVHVPHYRTGDKWCIYPMYDFAHPISDAIEGITHSMCSLEFIDNRAIYDWLMDHLFPAKEKGREPPRQYEFGRRSMEYTVVSKRKLRRLVKEGVVRGWDDPRMPTISAMRRRGVTPESVRAFASQIGVSRTNRTVDLAIFENAVRDDLAARAPRVMAVTRPLKVVIQNLDQERTLSLPYWPQEASSPSADGKVLLPSGERVPSEQAVREVPLTREIVIEHDDFSADPPKGFKRLTPGGAVRLRGAGIIRCDEVIKGSDGEPSELRVTLLGEDAKASGVIHWVSATRGVSAEFRLFDRLFTVPNPDSEAAQFDPEQPGHEDEAQPLNTDFMRFVNPNSLVVTRGMVEPSVAKDPASARYQFERTGYFWRDPVDSRDNALVFNRIITLKDTWAKKADVPETKAETKAKPEKKADAPAPAAPARVELDSAQQAVFSRLRTQGVTENEARLLARDPQLVAYLEGVSDKQVTDLASWVVNDLAAAIHAGTNRVGVKELAALVALVAEGSISARIAKDVLAEAQTSGEAPAAIVERKGLRVVSDEKQLRTAIQGVLDANPAKVAEYRGGKKGLTGFFTGQVMRATNGQADPKAVAKLLNEMLG